MSLQSLVIEKFKERYQTDPSLVVRAPGRVNLIGDHTDYNDGFVMPLAIDRAAWIALRPRSDREVHLHSLDYPEALTFSLDDMQKGSGWAEYVKGVAWVLKKQGHALSGWEGVVTGNVPMGAGLSSSAALELATARAFSAVSGIDWDAATMAQVGQQAENEWVGMECGIMDQMISAAGQSGHALLIDCRSLETTAVPIPQGTVVVVLDTATRRELVTSAYNERRAQCESAAQFFGVTSLRDVTSEQFQAHAAELAPLIRQRAQHVLTENARTLAAVEAMKQGDAHQLGKLMYESHKSLRDDFEVSGDGLNAMVECARKVPSCYGARMTGGGFAGCAVALVDQDDVENFRKIVSASYQEATQLTPNLYVCEATNGAEVL